MRYTIEVREEGITCGAFRLDEKDTLISAALTAAETAGADADNIRIENICADAASCMKAGYVFEAPGDILTIYAGYRKIDLYVRSVSF